MTKILWSLLGLLLLGLGVSTVVYRNNSLNTAAKLASLQTDYSDLVKENLEIETRSASLATQLTNVRIQRDKSNAQLTQTKSELSKLYNSDKNIRSYLDTPIPVDVIRVLNGQTSN